MNKDIYKPTECMKYMDVEMHPALLGTWYCANVSQEVSSAGAKVTPTTELCDPGLVMWCRRVWCPVSEDGQVQLSTKKQPCEVSLYVTQATELADHVASHSLSQHVGQIKDLVGHQLTLVVFGAKEYFKKSGRKTQNSSKKVMTEVDLKMAIADLLVTTKCNTLLVNAPGELALLIMQFTKAIANAPAKLAKRKLDEQAEFYMRGDNKKCIAVDAKGQGVSRLWQQMIAVLPHSSLEISRAICSQYSSPQVLYESLVSSNGVNELADIGVDRAGVPGSKSRRLGPEFARKLHTLLTAEDGNMLLD